MRLFHAERAQHARDKRLRAALCLRSVEARGVNELVGDVAASSARHQNLGADFRLRIEYSHTRSALRCGNGRHQTRRAGTYNNAIKDVVFSRHDL
jgi:hypothetical protein